jgi:hypothetical protein
MITTSGYWLKYSYKEEIIIMITTSGYWLKIILSRGNNYHDHNHRVIGLKYNL